KSEVTTSSKREAVRFKTSCSISLQCAERTARRKALTPCFREESRRKSRRSRDGPPLFGGDHVGQDERYRVRLILAPELGFIAEVRALRIPDSAAGQSVLRLWACRRELGDEALRRAVDIVERGRRRKLDEAIVRRVDRERVPRAREAGGERRVGGGRDRQ